MLVYCSNFSVVGSIDSILTVIAKWLSRKTHEEVFDSTLQSAVLKKFNDGSRCQIEVSGNAFPFLQAIRFTHGDREVSGRQWVTEVGLRQEYENSQVECSVLLRTEEISARVDKKIQPTVPYVVHDILRACQPSKETAGLSTTVLSSDSEIEGLSYTIEFSERRQPIILISPTEEGGYFVDIEKLRFQVESLADVVQIPIGGDTFHIGREIGNQYAAWKGAVSIIFPQVELYGKKVCPTRRLRPDELSEIISQGSEPEREILSILTHRTNLPRSWKHVSPEKVSELARKQKFAELRKHVIQSGRESAEYIAFFEDYSKELESQNTELLQKIDQLQAGLIELEGKCTQIEDEKRQLRHESESLKMALSRSSNRPEEASNEISLGTVRDIFDNVATEFSPRDVLKIISKLFSARVTVLESAWKSVDKSAAFKERKKLFDLLWKLADDYWCALSCGKSDTEARNVFGNSYSAKESESVESNKRARQLRTFMYKGKETVMMRHLKIGNKESKAQTIRVHFEWDPEDRKIAIGHCGPHLDHG